MIYVLVRSWHRLRTPYMAGQLTLCGLQRDEWRATADDLPAGRSCESCLRIAERARL